MTEVADMADLFAYLEWRGELGFEEAPLCEVDNLIFCLLAYVDLDGIVPSPGMGMITLRDAAKEYFFRNGEQERHPLGLIVPAEIISLFKHMAHTRRFATLELSDYVNEISERREMQFSAIAVRLPTDGCFVAFRGTDDTIIGWREDFNLAFLDEVPSQRRATDYLNALDLPPDTALWIGGHSKGGNLAVWGAVHASDTIRRRIHRIWSNDGPGFSEGTIASAEYRSLSDRISLILPTDSLVGLLLEHTNGYDVIASKGHGLSQHNGLSWEVSGSSFVRADGLSRRGARSEMVMREHISAMSKAEKETFVRLFFSALEATGAKTLCELWEGGFRRTLALIQAVAEWSREDREAAVYLLGKLFTMGKTAPPPPNQSSGAITLELSPIHPSRKGRPFVFHMEPGEFLRRHREK